MLKARSCSAHITALSSFLRLAAAVVTRTKVDAGVGSGDCTAPLAGRSGDGDLFFLGMAPRGLGGSFLVKLATPFVQLHPANFVFCRGVDVLGDGGGVAFTARG